MFTTILTNITFHRIICPRNALNRDSEEEPKLYVFYMIVLRNFLYISQSFSLVLLCKSNFREFRESKGDYRKE